MIGAAPAPDLPIGQFIFSTTQHKLFWDTEGTGAGVAVQLCTLSGSQVIAFPPGSGS